MGAHRSGTTWLHQLLGSSSQMACITYWDIRQQLHQGETVLEREQVERELAQKSENRGFDGAAVGIDLPEEYGWILEANAFDIYTRRPVSNTQFDRLQALIQDKNKQKQQADWLLLKNPVDFYDGFLNLDNKFPGSCFLFLHRHPFAVFRSQVSSWRNLWVQPNQYLATLDRVYAKSLTDPIKSRAIKRSLYDRNVLKTMLLTLAEAFEYHIENEDKMQAKSIRLRYEDLCADPDSSLKRISNWLQLEEPIRAPERLATKQRELSEDSMIAEVYRANSHRFKAYCNWQGYSIYGDLG
ncbi:sulfotransferase [Cyanobium sp. HWJ4-Hawea]|uniref:sulfotransferase n=1 Tax=Cyanobium sp. HWJ4-Hawea TaxID=2823713 RepID=UPI0020CC8614|nr:sulfotransferase [Cyanobium sp. HWJ4-Hawea]MCP9808960.1 sulfotransferase [Cyanobium sp. HWJ4-Hawea]